MSLFERLKESIDTVEVLRGLNAIYEAMLHRNFSSHLLQCAPQGLAVMEIQNVHWSDWGNSEHILLGPEMIGKCRAIVEDSLPFRYMG